MTNNDIIETIRNWVGSISFKLTELEKQEFLDLINGETNNK